MSDLISRQAAIDALHAHLMYRMGTESNKKRLDEWINSLPSAQPEIIRCRNCKFASGDSRICMQFGHSPIGELDFCAWAERKGEPMSDLIDRQAAIDIERNATVDTNPSHFEAHQKFTQFMDDAEISSFGRWQWSNGFNTALTAVGIDLKKLPSAQPEQQWIPCSERLPKQGQEVICQCRASIIKVLKLDAYGDWYQDAEHCYMGGFVIAWMPLPEPYQKEGGE